LRGAEGLAIRPETEQEREARHAASIAAYRTLVDPAAPPRAPFAFEHHFYAREQADVTGMTDALEAQGYKIETFAYNPDDPERTWVVVALKVALMEERLILAFSDELDALAREHEVVYDGWLTRVE
jgi:regulator of RNase E activity RraB